MPDPIDDHRRFSSIRRCLEYCESQMTIPSEDEDEGHSSDRWTRTRPDPPSSPISFASDSDDDAHLPPEVNAWRNPSCNRKLEHQSRDFSLNYIGTDEGKKGDLYEYTRAKMLELLSVFAPNAPKQPFVAYADNCCLNNVLHSFREKWSNKNTLKKREEDQERIKELEEDVERLKQRVHVLRSSRYSKEKTGTYEEKHKNTVNASKDDGTEFLKEQLKRMRKRESEYLDIRADLAKRDRQNLKLKEEVEDLQEDIRTIRADRERDDHKRVEQGREKEERRQRFRQRALDLLDKRQVRIEELRAELVNIAEGKLQVQDSSLAKYECGRPLGTRPFLTDEKLLGRFD
ncbi:unnamed protein product [Tilletia laevis]|uniref:Uncharacterized protein n=4 Tax=Tilletia TaxID=13289 RepID=A0A8X7SUQ0_9BASI|nr:hypothetical protein CF336_g6288 [Tilletia laevis]KAE8191096.1 hypothetical protein CF328_g5782 [Tilletia controversa]KAE8237853.1 hypothetical protein A4X03_0g9019 [Tilletia caries]KAE8242845.1 hypothetical protein A4X06_0g6730 [Tilletia controversa]CAD6898884.1 unnamed protein product [Tilletia laevis]